jgi:uncharacterized membrane protein
MEHRRGRERAAGVARSRHWYNPVAIASSLLLRPKVLLAVLVGSVVFLLSPRQEGLAVSLSLAWVAGGLAYLALALRIMWQYGTHEIRERAAAQDDSAVVILCLILAAIGASFVAIAGALSQVKGPDGVVHGWYLALAAATIVTSWSVTQVAFALHYAHEFYAPTDGQEEAEKGLAFPDDDEPDYWDFLYFSTAIGATSQTSDTGLRAKTMRRLVTLHGIISFFFNAMILALTINLASGLVQGLN